MNGRLYDPYLQRFLSPDNFVQSPTNAQNYNRYSYCVNNPLMFTDPSGWQMAAVGEFWNLGKTRTNQIDFSIGNYYGEALGTGSGWGGNGGVLPTGIINGKQLIDAYTDACNDGYTGTMNEFDKLIPSSSLNNNGNSITITYRTTSAIYGEKNSNPFILGELKFVSTKHSITLNIGLPNSTGGYPFDGAKIGDTWHKMRPNLGEHDGVDFYGNGGEKVRTVSDGNIVAFAKTVAEVKSGKSGGVFVQVLYNGYIVYYSHLAENATSHLKYGTIKQGEIIGEVGNTGRCDPKSYYHLHLQIWKAGDNPKNTVDPFVLFPFLKP